MGTANAHLARMVCYSRIAPRIFRAISGRAGIFIYREVLQKTVFFVFGSIRYRRFPWGSRFGAGSHYRDKGVESYVNPSAKSGELTLYCRIANWRTLTDSQTGLDHSCARVRHSL